MLEQQSSAAKVASTEAISDDWFTHHFDPLSPALGVELYETFERMRSRCPVAHSDQYGGFWVATRYEDVARVLQDWTTFSTEEGLTVPVLPHDLRFIPEEVDPPRHRAYRKVLNPYFTPAWVDQWSGPTRTIVNQLIDEFIETGECDFMTSFAVPYPGVTFFDLVMGAPQEDLAWLNEQATALTVTGSPDAADAWAAMIDWVRRFVAQRRAQPARGDFVDAIVAAEVDGRPVTDDEVVGTVWLHLQGGLETTAGALGQFMIRFCRQPEIPAMLRRQPDLIPKAVEALLRLDSPFVMVARTVVRDTELGGHPIRAGEKVVAVFVSANMDEAEFAAPKTFDPHQRSNRHMTFGAGPHRCIGSHLARMNLRIAVDELVRRLDNIQLQDAATPIPFHSAYNRAPLHVPITFTPGPRLETVS